MRRDKGSRASPIDTLDTATRHASKVGGRPKFLMRIPNEIITLAHVVMSFRSVLAGPSRLPIPRFPVQIVPAPSSQRHITIPHPDLDSSKGETRLAVRTISRIPSMIHAFAIVRAIEAKLGSVISIEVRKDYDTLEPQSTLLLTLLRPVQLPTPLYLEIPQPAISKNSNFLGGPSLDDVQAALRSTQTAADQGTINAEPLQFRVERLARRTDRPRRREYRNPRRVGREVEEDEEIVEALQKFGGGFYGGFEGLAEKLKHLARKDERIAVLEEAPATLEEASENVEAELPTQSPVPSPEDPIPEQATEPPRNTPSSSISARTQSSSSSSPPASKARANPDEPKREELNPKPAQSAPKLSQTKLKRLRRTAIELARQELEGIRKEEEEREEKKRKEREARENPTVSQDEVEGGGTKNGEGAERKVGGVTGVLGRLFGR